MARARSAFEDRVPKSRDWYSEHSLQPHLTQGLECVRSTVLLLDGCMRAMVELGPKFYDACASAEVSGLVLSFVALHRLLFEYVDDLLRRFAVGHDVRQRAIWRQGTATRTPVPELSSRARVAYASLGLEPTESDTVAHAFIDGFRERESLVALTNCLIDAASQVDAESAAARALPGPIGGVMMFLEYVSRALAVAQDAFAELGAAAPRDKGGRGGRQALARDCLATMTCFGLIARGKPRLGVAVAVTLALGLRSARYARMSERFRQVDSALQAAIRIWSITTVTLDDGLRLTREGQSYCSLLKPLTARGSLTELVVKATPAPSTLCFW